MSEQAAARLVGQRHLAEMIAVDIGDAVVLREPLVDERVVGGQEVEQRPILPEHVFDEQPGLGMESLPQILVEVGKDIDVRCGDVQFAECQPLRSEVLDERA